MRATVPLVTPDDWKQARRSVGLTLPFYGQYPLAEEPLTTEDWERVWLAHQGFRAQLRLIVAKARKRAKAQSPTLPKP